jgi:hypothetical protein
MVTYNNQTFLSLISRNTGKTPGTDANAWQIVGANIQGPQGLQGIPGLQGTQGPVGPQGETGPQGPTANITALEATVAVLQSQVQTLQAQLAAVQSNTVLALDGKLTYDAGRVAVVFTGVDLRLVNGLGRTDLVNGLGNLIVGYNEVSNDRMDYYCSNGMYQTQTVCVNAGETWGLNQRSGSHNIIMGGGNEYTQSGSMVGGTVNRSNARGGSILSGHGNTASGEFSAILSGEQGFTLARDTAVVGGYLNKALGDISAVSGGQGNIASGHISAVSGGGANQASGNLSSISGGFNRSVSGAGNWAAGSLFESQ